jgi:hypothetical protein
MKEPQKASLASDLSRWRRRVLLEAPTHRRRARLTRCDLAMDLAGATRNVGARCNDV